MPKMIVNLRSGISKDNFNNGDMLVYDSTKKEFYTVTEASFFDKTNSRINELIKKYDTQVEKMEQEKEQIKKDTEEFKEKLQKENEEFKEKIQEENEEFKEKIQEETKAFMLKIKESNQKLIEMVDSFIKGGN